mmetsp:Transcript_13617/g.20727  ORF Transcript_13617/g.20727 Transcript_13617/m.20727 type:complete len:438 (+) Transcript_13617:105-1418(+)|eukprot:CAMPEP_0178916630 /NCGR_PEP_ID=MMETSP0786-20121207/12762_1 /TAXON_ID=186022 /ORGANISM="Thalassionema frauenfeldii, Strain CCMP 1798" /LENGTH=437 /DNA_ID=CAMNT_0020590019 /DNA_START=23 /DNA_END=1336 /DNA_ORIENTATION=-
MTGITLSNPGNRNNKVTAEDAEKLVENWKDEIARNPNQIVETLDLSKRSYQVEAVKIICNFLFDKVAGVKKAILNDIIASLETEKGLEVLKDISQLLKDSPIEHLDLDDNAMGIRGVERCEAILSLVTLQVLSCQNDGFSEESMTRIKTFLQNKSNLRVLKFYNNMIGVGGAKETGLILKECINLSYFRYEGCRPLTEGTDSLISGLASAIKSKPQHPLERLELEVSLEGQSLDDLCNGVLKQLPSLKHLRLYDCSLDEDTCKPVLQALYGLQSLEQLDMSNNEIGENNVRKLAPIIKKNGTSLRMIKLEGAELNSRGVERLSKAFTAAGQPLALEELDLSCNAIGTRGAEALIAAQDAIPKLRVLNLDDNSFSEEILERLQHSFGDTLLEMPNNIDDYDNDDDLEESDDEEEERENIEGVIIGMAEVALTPDDVSL